MIDHRDGQPTTQRGRVLARGREVAGRGQRPSRAPAPLNGAALVVAFRPNSDPRRPRQAADLSVSDGRVRDVGSGDADRPAAARGAVRGPAAAGDRHES